jgi:feruloyl esterase
VNQFDMITALTEWVEQGRAPHALVGSRNDAVGTLLFARPVCEFPKYPRYDGAGDPSDVSSFRCVTPRRHGKNDD